MANRNDTDPDRIHRLRWWTLIVLSFSLLTISIDNTILNVALPTLDRELGAGSGELQWIVDAYMLVFAGLLLTAGALGDRFGRKRALTFGLAVFALGSLASALADSSEMLIAARAVMGIGGAFIMPSTLSIITNVFDERERPKAIAAWAAVAGLGIAAGPVIGGFLLEHFDWSAVFYVNVPIALLAIVAGRFLIPESKDPEAKPLDLVGAGLSIVGLTALVWAIIEAPSRGWTDGFILGALGLAVVVLAGFAAWELRSRHPMLDVRLFGNRRFTAASLSITLVFFAMFGMIFFLTQYLQFVMGFTALEAGVRIVPVAVGMIVGAGVASRLTTAVGAKLPTAAGLTLVATGMVLLTGAGVDTGYTLVAVVLLLIGLGIGLAMTPATDSVMGALPREQASVGSAMNDTTRQVGGALGVAVLGSLLASEYRADMDAAASGLPAQAAHAAQDSLGGALTVADTLGPAGRALAQTAEAAFVSGMEIAVLVAGAVALVGAVVALVWLPARATAPERKPERELDLATGVPA